MRLELNSGIIVLNTKYHYFSNLSPFLIIMYIGRQIIYPSLNIYIHTYIHLIFAFSPLQNEVSDDDFRLEVTQIHKVGGCLCVLITKKITNTLNVSSCLFSCVCICVCAGFCNGDVCRPGVCQSTQLSRNDRARVSAVTLLRKLLPPVHQQLQEQGRLLPDVSLTHTHTHTHNCSTVFMTYCILALNPICSTL